MVGKYLICSVPQKSVLNAYNMKCALKLLCLRQFLHTQTNTSYDVVDSHYLVDILSRGMRECAEAKVDEINDAEVLFIVELTSTEFSILFHFRGFLVKGTLKTIDKSEQCRGAELGSSSSEYANLTRLNKYVWVGNHLRYPSDEVMSLL